MSILQVRHFTRYTYRQPVSLGEHRLMMRPHDSYDQRLLEHALTITPRPVSLEWQHDVFNNCVGIARFAGRTDALVVENTFRIDHAALLPIDFTLAPVAEAYPFTYGAEDMPDLLRSIERGASDPAHHVDHWARQFLRDGGRTDTRAMLAAMSRAIRDTLTYVRREEAGVQPPAETLKIGSGSCRDFALLMMEAVRSLGLAARFVSGYLHTRSTPGRAHLGGGSTHAWMQVFLPGAGWVDYDPTNALIGNRDLIRVAVVRDPQQASPLSGTYVGFPADCTGMTVSVRVTEAEAPDQHTPDHHTPDHHTPDHHTPDHHTPDQRAPDERAGAASGGGLR